MTIRDAVYLGCTALVAVLLAGKLRQLRSRWGSPRVWAMCATLVLPAWTMWTAAPSNMRWVNRVSGVPNLGELLADSGVTACAAAFLALAMFWRHPVRTAWPRVRWILLTYALTILAMAVTFGLASVPEERVLGDFVTYYSTQPAIVAFTLIWLLSTLAGTAGLAYCCLSWSRDEDYADLPWLRRGLRLYGATGLVLVCYTLVKVVAVATSWFGVHALDTVSMAAPVVAALAGSVFITAALLLPVWGPRWPAVRGWAGRWRVFPILRSLHRALRPVDPDIVLVASGKRLDPHHRIRRMVIELSDWRWRLAPILDPAVGAAAARLGRQAGLSGDELSTTVEAAQLKAAVTAWGRGERAAAAATPDRFADDTLDGTDIQAELAWWVRTARAFRGSPVVARAVAEAAGAGADPGEPPAVPPQAAPRPGNLPVR